MKFVTNIKNVLFSFIVHAGMKKHHKNKNYQRAVAEAACHRKDKQPSLRCRKTVPLVLFKVCSYMCDVTSSE